MEFAPELIEGLEKYVSPTGSYIVPVKWSSYGTMNTETAGSPDFSGLPAFFVTNLLLVQCSI